MPKRNSHPPQIECDFQSDYAETLRAALARWDVHLDDGAPLEELSLTFHKVSYRIIEPRPRKFRSAAGFTCPDELKPGLNALKLASARGEDLTPFQSKSVVNVDEHDTMLSDFGIHHFHLGGRAGTSLAGALGHQAGGVVRSGPLLYAIVKATHVYAIGVRPHGHWAKVDLIDTVERNWPELLEPFRLRGVVGLETEVSDEDRARLRKAGINVPIASGAGGFYFSPGGGHAGTKTPVNAVRASDYNLEMVSRWEEHVREIAVEQLVPKVASSLGRTPNRLRFRFHVEGETACVFEEQSRILFRLGPFRGSD